MYKGVNDLIERSSNEGKLYKNKQHENINIHTCTHTHTHTHTHTFAER